MCFESIHSPFYILGEFFKQRAVH